MRRERDVSPTLARRAFRCGGWVGASTSSVVKKNIENAWSFTSAIQAGLGWDMEVSIPDINFYLPFYHIAAEAPNNSIRPEYHNGISPQSSMLKTVRLSEQQIPLRYRISRKEELPTSVSRHIFLFRLIFFRLSSSTSMWVVLI